MFEYWAWHWPNTFKHNLSRHDMRSRWVKLQTPSPPAATKQGRPDGFLVVTLAMGTGEGPLAPLVGRDIAETSFHTATPLTILHIQYLTLTLLCIIELSLIQYDICIRKLDAVGAAN